jgi:hypothetical protein
MVLYDNNLVLNSFNSPVIFIFIVQKEGFGHEQFKNSHVACTGSCALSPNGFAGLWSSPYERFQLLRRMSSRGVSSCCNGAHSSYATLGIQPQTAHEVFDAWVNFKMQAAYAILRTNQLHALLRTGLSSALLCAPD